MKIGVIGYSKFNGHPYSLSAIINGTNRKNYNICPYKYIKKYLRNYKKNLSPAKITHIWCKNISISKRISKFAKIDNVCKDFNEMAPEIDAVMILINEEKAKHKIFSYFKRFNIPIFIDKPLCTSKKYLNKYKKDKSKFFSISSFYFSKDRAEFEKIINKNNRFKIICKIGKGWKYYGIHILDFIRNTLPNLNDVNILKEKNKIIIRKTNSQIIEIITYKNKIKPSIEVITPKNKKKFHCSDTLNSMRNMLISFISSTYKNNKKSFKTLEYLTNE